MVGYLGSIELHEDDVESIEFWHDIEQPNKLVYEISEQFFEETDC